jgi:hypothetical protein
MKTGPQKPRLSEKLNADLEAIRAEHRGLINSQLENFRSDLTNAANDALTTIDSATEQLKMRKKPGGTWMLMAAVGITVAALILLTITAMTWLNSKTGLTRLGIETVDEAQATYLLLTSPEMRLTTCRVGAQTINCIRIGRE